MNVVIMRSDPEMPYEIVDVCPEETKVINKCLKGYMKGFIKCGPAGYIMPKRFKKSALAIYTMDVRPDDIWVITFPRSGTTWTQEIVWLLENNMNFYEAEQKPLYDRFPMLEISSQVPEIGNFLVKANFMNLGDFQGLNAAVRTQSWKMIENLPSPRFIKTHLPLSMLPPNLLNRAKVIYVARDPRDTAVSYFYLHKMVYKNLYKCTFADFWEAFKRDLLPWTPVISHANEAWLLKDHPNLHFMFYEDLKKDLTQEIHKLSVFLGRKYTDSQIQNLKDHVSFENLKKNKNVNNTIASKEKSLQFVREGKSGGWKNYFNEKMADEAEEYLQQRLSSVSIRYPSIPVHMNYDYNMNTYL